ncbi:MAG: DNA helicase RecQ [Candidatus Wallbacteria bacterium]
MYEDPHKILQQHFGYSKFRDGQQEIISAIISGRDALGIMPTGAGKSLCFQIPALMFKGTVIVISPLISLMKDQVEALRQAGLPAAFINSTLTGRERKEIENDALEGKYKLIYMAPERLENPEFLKFLNDISVSMVTVDEAHCVSQWGHDFRPSYLKIPNMIEMLAQKPIISAFTATATPIVKNDIMQLLKLNNPVTVVTGFDRKNLYFEVNKPSSKSEFTLDYVRKNSGKSGIIYCITRKLVESVCDILNSNGIPAVRYHAGLSQKERSEAQEKFIFEDAGIIVATNAFGMGIDKSNVRFVLHYNMPKNIESYYQEAGRAGRDGEKAECILLFSGQDIIMNKFLIENSDRDKEKSGGERSDKSGELRKLSQMVDYCSTTSCIRRYVLNYFGENHTYESCGNCGSCLSAPAELTDMTECCRKILSCIKLMGERFGRTFVSEVLRGSNPERSSEFGFNRLSVYGALKEYSQDFIKDTISALADAGYIKVDSSQYQTLSLSFKALNSLNTGEKILIKAAEIKSKSKAKAKTKTAPQSAGDSNLFDRLRALRRDLALKQRVPPYLIFSDAALNSMCQLLPSTDEDFLEVNGVGRRKLEQYGEIFMDEIKQFQDSKRG